MVVPTRIQLFRLRFFFRVLPIRGMLGGWIKFYQEVTVLPKKYRDKVRKRAEEMRPLLKDQQRLRLAVKLAFFSDVEALSRRTSIPRREITPGEPVPGQEVHNFVEHLRMLVMEDVPALLNALETESRTMKGKHESILEQ